MPYKEKVNLRETRKPQAESADTYSMPAEKRRTSVGVLFWIALILLVLVIFLANRSNIEQVLETTGLVDAVRHRFDSGEEETDAPSLPTDATDPAPEEPAPVRFTGNDPVDRTAPEPAPPVQNQSPSTTVTTEPEPTPEPSARTSAEEEAPAVDEPAQRAPSPDPAKPNRYMAGLYYIKVTDDGRTFPQRVVRPVYYASSPLTETINTLIGGPSGDELADGLLNLIPDGTQLLSAQVRNSVAYLNFNENFRFNPLGAEGTVAQLLQIIYSSTEFPTVSQVQFLVEGETIDYLGGDGIYVGEPLGRNAFSS
jgi:spore germination protein GerM